RGGNDERDIVPRRHGACERGQIEAPARVSLNEISPGMSKLGERADFNFAKLRNTADRDDPRLETTEQGNDRIDIGAHLKHGAVMQVQAQVAQGHREAVAYLVQFGIGDATVVTYI